MAEKRATAIAVYHVSAGIDQCRVGFLQRHFVTHAKIFDGALAHVTEVYGAGSESTVKRKKLRHNRGCCLAALISNFRHQQPQYTSTTTNTFLAKIAKGDEEDEAEEMSGRNEVSFVSYDYPGASIAVLTAQPAQHDAAAPDLAATATGISQQQQQQQQQQCHFPPAKEATKKQSSVTPHLQRRPPRNKENRQVAMI